MAAPPNGQSRNCRGKKLLQIGRGGELKAPFWGGDNQVAQLVWKPFKWTPQKTSSKAEGFQRQRRAQRQNWLRKAETTCPPEHLHPSPRPTRLTLLDWKISRTCPQCHELYLSSRPAGIWCPLILVALGGIVWLILSDTNHWSRVFRVTKQPMRVIGPKGAVETISVAGMHLHIKKVVPSMSWLSTTWRCPLGNTACFQPFRLQKVAINQSINQHYLYIAFHQKFTRRFTEKINI